MCHLFPALGWVTVGTVPLDQYVMVAQALARYSVGLELLHQGRNLVLPTWLRSPLKACVLVRASSPPMTLAGRGYGGKEAGVPDRSVK